MGKLVLYSTNVFVKYYIQRRWRNNVHYVWCSEEFDSAKARSYSPSGQIPPTSNPLDIYRDLKRAVEAGDTHNAKIVEQRNTLLQLAIEWETKGEISAATSFSLSVRRAAAPSTAPLNAIAMELEIGPVLGCMLRLSTVIT